MLPINQNASRGFLTANIEHMYDSMTQKRPLDRLAGGALVWGLTEVDSVRGRAFRGRIFYPYSYPF